MESSLQSESMNCLSATKTRCSSGILLPAWEPSDNISYNDSVLRSTVYFLCLLYMFLGVSIIADKFMTSIEVITSKEKQLVIKRKGIKQVIRVRIWNETVSNLTLMALGSSAPEILLSVIEIIGKGFNAGDLGPSTIVGSAAFNLFVIIGICVLVIPNGQSRTIHHRSVFFITATWSIFAYLWLYFIIGIFSPNVIDLWEAVLTFLFFPATVITAYIADTKIFIKRFLPSKVRGIVRFSRRDDTAAAVDDEADMAFKGLDDADPNVRAFERHRKEYIEVLREIRKEHVSLDPQELEKLAQIELLNRGPKSRAFYRMEATRQLTGAGSVLKKSRMAQMNQNLEENDAQEHEGVENKVFFDPGHYTVMENVGCFNVVVRREGRNPKQTIFVDYKTADGTAVSGEDYVPTEGTLVFEPFEMQKEVALKIIDDAAFEEDEHFYVQLSNPRVGEQGEEGKTEEVELTNPSMATIMILDDDHRGVFHFGMEDCEFSEACGTAALTVYRSSGSRGHVRVPFETIDGTAKGNGDDYESQKGFLDFPNDVIEQQIEVKIIDDEEYEKNEFFFVQLGEPVLLDEHDNSEKKKSELPRLGEFNKLKVLIIESTEFKSSVDKLLKKVNVALFVGTSSWKEQFVEAITVNPGGDGLEANEEAKPSVCNYIMHFVSIFWKILFACVPPTDYLSGWVTFICSIIVIGIMTALIGDLASHFGCSAGLTESVTAITFVAFGTSVPDTFASKTAALNDKYADSSVGNVNGSNAVNVFLGIGLAWTIAAVYHTIQGTEFRVQAGSLGFSVTIFCLLALVCIVFLSIRRCSFFGGELGGKRGPKIFTGVFFISLWFVYVILASLENYCHIKGF